MLIPDVQPRRGGNDDETVQIFALCRAVRCHTTTCDFPCIVRPDAHLLLRMVPENYGIMVNYRRIKRTLMKKEDIVKIMLVPTRIFFTKGVGIHRDRLASYELALRKAGIERCNLVNVSSIFPPNCKEISTLQGLEALKSGGITYCVMARNETNEPNRLVSAAIGLALPKEAEEYGYLSEHHAFGETKEKTGEYAEDLAATMLATTLGIEFDLNAAWSEREQIYKASGKIIKTKHVCQSAEGDKNGLWTTVIAVAVFL